MTKYTRNRVAQTGLYTHGQLIMHSFITDTELKYRDSADNYCVRYMPKTTTVKHGNKTDGLKY